MPTRARAPGSVTVVFAPVADGSLGASLATADGVVAAVSPAPETTVRLDGEPTAFEPVERLCADLGVTAAVELTAEVPVGRGFGASGAATLATALAADAEFGLGRDRAALVEAAARAEVAAGTGLGDVYVQQRGGLVYDAGDGRTRVARADPLRYASWGGVPTESVLGDEAALARVREAGHEALGGFDPDWSLPRLFEWAWGFARETGLPTEAVRERVRAAGPATMAMVGETVVGAGEEADGRLPERTRVTPEGARLL